MRPMDCRKFVLFSLLPDSHIPVFARQQWASQMHHRACVGTLRMHLEKRIYPNTVRTRADSNGGVAYLVLFRRTHLTIALARRYKARLALEVTQKTHTLEFTHPLSYV